MKNKFKVVMLIQLIILLGCINTFVYGAVCPECESNQAEYLSDGKYTHTLHCYSCGSDGQPVNHGERWELQENGSHHGYCPQCNYDFGTHKPAGVWNVDGDQHKIHCSTCGSDYSHTKNPGDWQSIEEYNTDKHVRKCKDCDIVIEQHVPTAENCTWIYDGSKYVQTCNLCKLPTGGIMYQLPKLELSVSNVEIDKGKTFTISNIKTDIAVEWSVDKSSIATISPNGNSCTITGVGVGTTWVYATMVGNSNTKAACQVTVSEPTHKHYFNGVGDTCHVTGCKIQLTASCSFPGMINESSYMVNDGNPAEGSSSEATITFNVEPYSNAAGTDLLKGSVEMCMYTHYSAAHYWNLSEQARANYSNFEAFKNAVTGKGTPGYGIEVASSGGANGKPSISMDGKVWKISGWPTGGHFWVQSVGVRKWQYFCWNVISFWW